MWGSLAVNHYIFAFVVGFNEIGFSSAFLTMLLSPVFFVNLCRNVNYTWYAITLDFWNGQLSVWEESACVECCVSGKMKFNFTLMISRVKTVINVSWPHFSFNLPDLAWEQRELEQGQKTCIWWLYCDTSISGCTNAKIFFGIFHCRSTHITYKLTDVHNT